MALLLKTLYNGYFYFLNEKADPRANDYFFIRFQIPTVTLLFLWHQFVFKWGPKLMENRPPFDLKHIMVLYNIIQVLTNAFIVFNGINAVRANTVNWRCMPIDYSESYWGRRFLLIGYIYYLLKLADLLDTVFFILRKKHTHVSFLHTYHHFAMVIVAWMGCKFLGGGHSYFFVITNCIVHTILYSYYLLTAYDSKYGKLLWLKKFITQAQLLQFVFLLFVYGQFLWVECSYPKGVLFLFIPQNLFMIILFGDFYITTYILAPRKKKNMQKEAKRLEATIEQEKINN